MDTQAWVAAIEGAIAILYLAIVGERSVSQMIDDRRRQAKGTAQAEPPQGADTPQVTPQPRPRLLSVQSVGAYIDYVWRDPLEAAAITGKAFGLGITLIGGFGGILLVIGAILAAIVGSVTNSAAISGAAGALASDGFASLITAFSIGVLLTAGSLWGLDSLEKERLLHEAEVQKLVEQRAQQSQTAAYPLGDVRRSQARRPNSPL